jgi:hypothetical protein
VMKLGAAGLGHLYYSDSCTVNVTFNPKRPGPRYGAVVLKSTSGAVIATAYIYGVWRWTPGGTSSSPTTASLRSMRSTKHQALHLDSQSL